LGLFRMLEELDGKGKGAAIGRPHVVGSIQVFATRRTPIAIRFCRNINDINDPSAIRGLPPSSDHMLDCVASV